MALNPSFIQEHLEQKEEQPEVIEQMFALQILVDRIIKDTFSLAADLKKDPAARQTMVTCKSVIDQAVAKLSDGDHTGNETSKEVPEPQPE